MDLKDFGSGLLFQLTRLSTLEDTKEAYPIEKQGSSKQIKRRFVTVASRQFHYIFAGSGPPVILLHSSPKTSMELAPLVQHLSQHFTAICFDTPGYGFSDGLEIEAPEIGDYADAMAEAVAALKIKSVPIYGRHTGALIAYEIIRRRPGLFNAAVFDGFPMFTREEGQDFLDNYLPEFVPQWDGTHLIAIWARARQNYMTFPWYRNKKSNRTNMTLPEPQLLNETVIDILRANYGYGHSYKAAFRYVPPQSMQELTFPTLFMAKKNDLICGHLDRLPKLPDSCVIERVSGENIEWAQRIESFFMENSASENQTDLPGALEIAKGITQRYTDVDGFQLLFREIGGRSISPPPAQALQALHL
ncbi:alpha/beta hydrolase [Thermodesulfobacteriota bacterium]